MSEYSPEPPSPVYSAASSPTPIPEVPNKVEALYLDIRSIVAHVTELEVIYLERYKLDHIDLGDELWLAVEKAINEELSFEREPFVLPKTCRFSLVALGFQFPIPRAVLGQLRAADHDHVKDVIVMQALVRAAQLSRAITGDGRDNIMLDTRAHAHELAVSLHPDALSVWPHLTIAVGVALLRLGANIPGSFSTVPDATDLAHHIFRPRTPRGGRIKVPCDSNHRSTEQLEDRLPFDAAAFLYPCARCNPCLAKKNQPHMICYAGLGIIKCLACTQQHKSGCANQIADLSNPHYKRMAVPRAFRALRLGEKLRATLAGRASHVLELAAFVNVDSAAEAAQATEMPTAMILEDLAAASRELFEAYREMFGAAARAETIGIDVGSFLTELALKAFATPDIL